MDIRALIVLLACVAFVTTGVVVNVISIREERKRSKDREFDAHVDQAIDLTR